MTGHRIILQHSLVVQKFSSSAIVRRAKKAVIETVFQILKRKVWRHQQSVSWSIIFYHVHTNDDYPPFLFELRVNLQLVSKGSCHITPVELPERHYGLRQPFHSGNQMYGAEYYICFPDNPLNERLPPTIKQFLGN